MHISIYVRHSADCPKKSDRYWKRCKCPKWFQCAEWVPDRRSAKTRSWDRAEQEARRLEAGEAPKDARQTVADAVDLFLADKKQQQIVGAYHEKLTLELGRFVDFCRAKPAPYLSDINLILLEEFRATWPGVAITRRKKQERLRSFFHYCVRHDWLRTNPAAKMSRVKVEQKPTDYFNQAEFAKLLDAIPLLGMDSRNPNQGRWRQKLRALILLMRWSGLRIGDAVTLPRQRIQGDSLFLYTQKTGVPVYVPLPPKVVEELRALPNSNMEYFFWSGHGTVKSAVGDYQRSFARLCKHANLGKRSHPHMLRDTFAVELLLKGVSIEQVAILLGHSSIRITERNYSPFVKARQEQLEAAVKAAWTTGR